MWIYNPTIYKNLAIYNLGYSHKKIPSIAHLATRPQDVSLYVALYQRLEQHLDTLEPEELAELKTLVFVTCHRWGRSWLPDCDFHGD